MTLSNDFIDLNYSDDINDSIQIDIFPRIVSFESDISDIIHIYVYMDNGIHPTNHFFLL